MELSRKWNSLPLPFYKLQEAAHDGYWVVEATENHLQALLDVHLLGHAEIGQFQRAQILRKHHVGRLQITMLRSPDP